MGLQGLPSRWALQLGCECSRSLPKRSSNSSAQLYCALRLSCPLQALQQPPGRLSQRQHINCVLPLFLEPAGTYLLYTAWNLLATLAGRRDAKRLEASTAKRQKMITALKASL